MQGELKCQFENRLSMNVFDQTGNKMNAIPLAYLAKYESSTSSVVDT